MCEETSETPVWIHFGAGNIFRGFIAGLHQKLLHEGLARSEIIAAETFDFEIIDKITSRPADSVRSELEALGIEDMNPVITLRNTYIAPFVNAEVPQYLVIEDRFLRTP